MSAQDLPEDAPLTPEQLDHLHRKLLDMRAALLQELDTNPGTAPEESGGVGDQADQASAESDHDIQTLTRERLNLRLDQLDQALGRIAAGRYGICEDTGEPIGFARLEAQPTATLSLAAQEKRERGAAG